MQNDFTSPHYLRRRQREVLTEMIKTAYPLDENGEPLPDAVNAEQDQDSMMHHGEDGNAAIIAPPTVWRLLIFDDWGMNIIAPILKVGDLRSLGITLYMHIKTERDPVPGAPTIYFCEPTEENASLIAKDCGEGLYEWIYINFTAQAPRALLESLARQLADRGLSSIHHIKLFDRTLSYVALDNDLFSLLDPKSFLTLNRQNVPDEEIERQLNAVVQGVCHVLLSLQVLPIVAHSKTGAAEEVARRLSVRLNDAVKENLLTGTSSSVYGRPLLLLVDRSSDIATALHHPFTYRGLLVEVGGMRLNKCVVHGQGGKDEVVEIDPDRDNFYSENANLDFSAIGSNIQEALQQYKQEYQTLAEQSAGGSDDSYSDANTMSRLLATTPMLVEEKRCLDTHAKLAHSFLHVIQNRLLDHFHGVESNILHGNMDRSEVARLLSTNNCTLDDRQRLLLIAYLMSAPNTEDDAFVSKQAELLISAVSHGASEQPGTAGKTGAATELPAYKYLKHLRGWSLNKTSGHNHNSASNASEGLGWGFAQQFVKNIAGTLGRKEETELPLTKLVSALMQDVSDITSYDTHSGGGGGRSSDSALRHKLLDTVAAIDPRTRNPVDLHHVRFSQSIVFTIGGGSIAEYDDLKNWEASREGKSIYYGCTSIVSGEEMLKQLITLGSELS